MILNVFYRDYEMPAWVRRLLFDKIAHFVRVDVPLSRTQHYLDKMNKDESYNELNTINETTIVNGNTYGTTEDDMSNVNGDFYQNRKLSQQESQGNSRKKKSTTNAPTDLNYNNTSNPQITIGRTRHFSPATEMSPRHIDERKLLAEDWKMAARIMDRVMLIVAIFVGVVSFIIIFSHAPRFREMFVA